MKNDPAGSARSAKSKKSSRKKLIRERKGGMIVEALEARIAPAATVNLAVQLTTGNDLDHDGVADPGEVLHYTVTIANGATSISLSNLSELINDPNLTLVPGSFNVQPLAIDDAFNAVGNTTLRVGGSAGTGPEVYVAGGTVLANDVAIDDAFTLTPIVSGATAHGGLVNLASDGTFTFVSKAGDTGTDSFTYTITDTHGLSNTATVSIALTGKVWYVDNSGVNGSGTSLSPFNNLAAAQSASGVGDTIYVATGTGTYANTSLTLQNSQTLVGAGSALDFLLPAGTPSGLQTVKTAGTAPTFTSTGTALTLGSGNTIKGFTIGDAVTDISGLNFGTLKVGNVTLNGTGNSLDLLLGTFAGLSGGAASFNSVTSTLSSTWGLHLDNVSGSVDFGSTTISGSSTSNEAILVNNSTIVANFGNTVIGTASASSGGSIGLHLTSDSGTFTFGTLDIKNTTGRGLEVANCDATVNVTGAANISNTTGDGVAIVNGLAPVSFQTSLSLDTIGGKGILLSGAGGSFNTGTGGTMTNITGNRVEITGGTVVATITESMANGGSARAVLIDNHETGNVTISGSITGAGGSGILVQNVNSGTITFSGATKTLNTGASDALTLTNNNGSTIGFTGGGLGITTTSGSGMVATNTTAGGSINITGANNSISTATGRILNWDGINVGGSGVTFASLAASGTVAATAISLNNVDGSGNTFNGGSVTVTGTSGATSDGLAITGGSAANFTFASTTIGGASAIGRDGINLNGANGSVTFTTATINNTGSHGVEIVGATNNITINGGNIGATNDPAGSGVLINGSSAASITVAAPITKTTAGDIVSITGVTAGSITFSGNLSATGAVDNGISVTSNSAGTITFSGSNKTLTTGANAAVTLSNNAAAQVQFTNGGLAITTTSGTGFSATASALGTGTIFVGGGVNTINSSSGTALNVVNTPLAGTFQFQSITSGTASNSGPTGIILDNTGSGGGLTVTGTGSAGSGGTIQHKTGADGSTTSGIGIYLNNTSSVSLSWMQLNDFQNFAIRGTGVNNLTMDHIVVNGTNGDNGGLDEGSVIFGYTTAVDSTAGVTGSATISNSTFGGGSIEDTFRIRNGSGTLDRVTFSNDSFACLNATGDALNIEEANSAIVKVTVQNSFFTSAAGDLFQFNPNGTNTTDLVFTGNTVSNNNPLIATGGGGVSILNNGQSNFTFNIASNSFRDAHGHALLLVHSEAGSSTMVGTITGNTFGVSGVANSGSLEGDAIKLQMVGKNGAAGGIFKTTISGNTIQQYNNFGIDLLCGGGTVGGHQGTFEAIVTGNNVGPLGTNTSAAQVQGIGLTAGTQANDAFNVYLQLGGTGIDKNIVNNDPTLGDIRVRQRFATSVHLTAKNGPGSTDYTGGQFDNTAVANFIIANNTTTNLVSASNSGLGGGFTGGAPPLLFAPTPLPPVPVTTAPTIGGDPTVTVVTPPVESVVPPTSTSTNTTGSTPVTGDGTPDTTAVSQPPAVGSATSPTTDSTSLNQAQLDSLVAAAIMRWEAAGLTPAQDALLHSVTFSVQDLPGWYLGEATAGHVTLDKDAAGNGWFVDATPLSDEEYVNNQGHLSAAPTGAAAGRLDALTTIVHELGHQLGLEDSYLDADANNVMYGYLHLGERRLAAAHQADGAVPHLVSGGADFLFTSMNLGDVTLAANKTLTINFDATINTFPAGKQPPSVATQVRLAYNDGTAQTADSNTVTTTVDSLTLGNLVFRDNNSNGVFDAGDVGIDGVSLNLFVDTNNSGSFENGIDTLVASTTTAGGGLYSFTNLAPGNYLVRVPQSNFAPGGALQTMQLAAGSNTDPDDNIDNDSNVSLGPVNGAATKAMTLAFNTEPTNGIGNDTNNTLDLGFVPATLSATLTSGALTIADLAGLDNTLTAKLVNGGLDLEINDLNERFTGTPGIGALSNGNHTLTIPLSAVTGAITFNTAAGNDLLTLDLSGGGFINASGIDFNGGNPTVAPGDKLVIVGGSQGTVTYNYSNAHDGSIAMSNFGTVRYTGLEPILNSGTATDVVFNLPSGPNTAVLSDDGTANNGLLRLSGSTFEQTDFAVPSGSITIHRGDVSDALTINALPEINPSVTIGGAGAEFGTVTFADAVTLAANKNLSVDALGTISFPNPTSDLALSGTGSVTLTTAKNIAFQTGSSVSVVNGDLTLKANVNGTFAGNTTGIVLNAASLSSSGSGNILVTGRGGDAPGSFGDSGVALSNSSITSTGTGAITVTGTGGTALSGNVGVSIAGLSQVSSGVGKITVNGTSGPGATSGSQGVLVSTGAKILSPGSADIEITGASGSPAVGVGNFGVSVDSTEGAVAITTASGNIGIIADSINITSATTLSASTKTVTLRQKTNGTAINIGGADADGSPGTLGLSDAELDTITAGTVLIGDANSGPVTVTAVISPNNYETLDVEHSASFTASGGFASDVNSASAYEKMVVNGAVTIDSAAQLTVTAQGGFVPAAGDVFTIINNTSANSTTGNFAGKTEGSIVVVGGVNELISYQGGTGNNDVVLQATAVSVTVGAPATVTEGGVSSLVYTFTRTGDLTGALPVSFTTGGTATFTSDYTTSSSATTFDYAAGTLTIPAGQASVTVTLTTVDDSLVEADETAILTVVAGNGYGASGSPATGTIADNDTATVSIAKLNDGAEASTPANGAFRVSLSAISSTDTVVNYTVGGTATSGVDFTPLSGTVTILAGQTTADIIVPVIDDTTVEPTEMVTLTLAGLGAHNPGVSLSGTPGALAATANITDNDTATVSIAKLNDGAETNSPTDGAFRVTLSAASSTDTVVNYTIGGTATSGSDFTALSGTVTILAGETTADIVVPVLNDAIVEGTETVTATLASLGAHNSGVSLSSTPGALFATVNITDDDVATWSLSGSSNVTEGANASYTLSLAGLLESGQTATTAFAVTDLTTTAADHAGVAAGISAAIVGRPELSFDGTTLTYTGNGAPMAPLTFSVAADDDSLVEATETFRVALANPGSTTGAHVAGASLVDTAIADNDIAAWSITGDSTVTEGLSATYTISLAGILQAGQQVSIAPTLADNTAFFTDHGDLSTAIQAAISTRPEFTYDGTGTLTYTGEGSAMVPLVFHISTTNHPGLNGPVDFVVGLANPGSPTGAQVTSSGAVDTTIVDSDTDLIVGSTGTSGNRIAGLGTDNVIYTFTVQNNGYITATNVVLDELFTLPSGVTFSSAIPGLGAYDSGHWTIPSLAAGASATLTLNFTADHTTAASSTATVKAQVASVDQRIANPGDDSYTALATISRQSDLAITKTDSPDPVGPGTQLTYTIVVSNNGPSDNTSAHITDILPPGLSNVTWTAAINGGGVGNLTGTGNIDETVTELAAGGTVTYTVHGIVSAPANSNLNNTAAVSSSEDTDGNNNTATAGTYVGGVDLYVGKTDNTSAATLGSTLIYTLTYGNKGFLTATGVKLTETVPAGATFDSTNSSEGWAETAPGSHVYEMMVGSIDPAGTGSRAFAVKVNTIAPAGVENIVNDATIADDHSSGPDINPGDNLASDSDSLAAAANLVVSKTADRISIARGHTLNYTISYSNTGDQDASGVMLREHVPMGTFVDLGASPGWVVAEDGSGDYIYTVGTVAAGAPAVSAHFGVFVPFNSPDSIVNNVSIDDDHTSGPDANTLDNAATLNTPIYRGIYAVSPGVSLPGKGAPAQVRVFDIATNTEVFSISAYEGYRDSVRIAVGDLNGDGYDDIITATRTGTGRVRVFDGLTGNRFEGPLSQIDAFDGHRQRGAFVASGDVTGDGRDDIIVGTALGSVGGVKVFDGVTGALVISDPVFKPSFRGGIRVAAGDLDGDGVDEIVAGQGYYGADVKVLSLTGEGESLHLDQKLTFHVGKPSYKSGVSVAITSDMNHDGLADILVGNNRGKPTQVSTYSGVSGAAIGTPVLPFGTKYNLGVRVAAADVNFDGVADIIAGSGGLAKSSVKFFDGATHTELTDLGFAAFPQYPSGALFVAASYPVPLTTREV